MRAGLAARQGATVMLTALVEDSAAYRKPDFLYRTHDLLKVRCIPTLIRMADGARLVEGECGDAAKVAELFSV